MRPSFRKEFWGPPSSSSCVTVSTEGIIAVATISSLHVMLPTLDPCGFEYTWAYIDSEKLKPTFLVDRTGKSPPDISHDALSKWLAFQYDPASMTDNYLMVFRELKWSPTGGIPGAYSFLAARVLPNDLLIFAIDYSCSDSYVLNESSKLDLNGLRVMCNFGPTYLAWIATLGLPHQAEITNFEWRHDLVESGGARRLQLIVTSSRVISFWSLGFVDDELAAELTSHFVLGDQVRVSSLLQCGDSLDLGTSTGQVMSFAMPADSEAPAQDTNTTLPQLCQWELKPFSGNVDTLSCCSSRRYVIASSNGTAAVIDLAAKELRFQLSKLHSQQLCGLCFLRNIHSHESSSTFATASLDGALRYWQIVCDDKALIVQALGEVYKSQLSLSGIAVDRVGLQIVFIDTVPRRLVDTSESQVLSLLRSNHIRLSILPSPLFFNSEQAIESPAALVVALHDYLQNNEVYGPYPDLYPLLRLALSALESPQYKPTQFDAVEVSDEAEDRRMYSIYTTILGKRCVPITLKLETLFEALVSTFSIERAGSPRQQARLCRCLHMLCFGVHTYLGLPLPAHVQSITLFARETLMRQLILSSIQRMVTSGLLNRSQKLSDAECITSLALMSLFLGAANIDSFDLRSYLRQHYNLTLDSESSAVDLHETCVLCSAPILVQREELLELKSHCNHCSTTLDRCIYSFNLLQPSRMSEAYLCRVCGLYADCSSIEEKLTFRHQYFACLNAEYTMICSFCSVPMLQFI